MDNLLWNWRFLLRLSGFPCQSFSVIGSPQGSADPCESLTYEITRVLRAKQPVHSSALRACVPYNLRDLLNEGDPQRAFAYFVLLQGRQRTSHRVNAIRS